MNKDETINTKKCTRSQTREKELSQKCNIEDQADHQPFIYELDGVILVFLCMSEDYIMKCPICKMETKYIVQHVAQNKTCQNYVKPDEFKDQFTIFKKPKTIKDKRNCKRKSRDTLREKDHGNVKDNQKKHKASSRANLRANNPER